MDLHGGEFALLCNTDLLAFSSPLGQPLPVPTVACLEGVMMLMVMMMLSMMRVVMMMISVMMVGMMMMLVVITPSLLDNNFKY